MIYISYKIVLLSVKDRHIKGWIVCVIVSGSDTDWCVCLSGCTAGRMGVQCLPGNTERCPC